MKISEAIQEARAIDGRAASGLIPPLEDALRAMELMEYFAEVIAAEPTEERQQRMSALIVRRINE